MKIFDAHAHVGSGRYYRVSADKLLSEMERFGLKKSFICPGESEIASNPSRANKKLAKIKEKYQSIFFLWAAANPWEGRKAVKLLREAKKMGFDGLKLNGHLHGYRVSDDIVKPLVEAAGDFGWPVYVHTGTPVTSEPLQLVNLAESFPDIDFIMGHTAFADFWYDVVDSLKRCPNLYAETSTVVPSVIKSIISGPGTNRLLFGSDFPNCHIGVELTKINRLGLSKSELQKVLAENLESLLGI